MAGFVSRLFEELALSAGEGIFAGIEAAGGDLVEILRSGVAILALEKDERIALAL